MRTLICFAFVVVLVGACGDDGAGDRSVDPTTPDPTSAPTTSAPTTTVAESVLVTAVATATPETEADVVIAIEERISVDDDEPTD